MNRRRRSWLLGAGVFVVLLASGLLLGVFTDVIGNRDHTAVGNTPNVSVNSRTPESTFDSDGVAEPALIIESAKTMPYSPVWNPPDNGQDFWQVVDPSNGYPETGGTNYVLAHSCVDRECVGNLVRSVTEGDTVSFLGDTYVVEEKRELPKQDIADQDIWYHDATRLVIITCIRNDNSGNWEDNDIIVATRAT